MYASQEYHLARYLKCEPQLHVPYSGKLLREKKFEAQLIPTASVGIATVDQVQKQQPNDAYLVSYTVYHLPFMVILVCNC